MAQDNLIAISKVADRLGDLADRVVFIGGATLELLAPDPGGAPPRITKDVDVVVEVSSSLDYLSRLAADLTQRGFRQLLGAPIFRWTLDETTVDFLPTRTEILGFSDRWYPEAFTHAVDHFLPDGRRIRLVTTPYFLAMKLDAYNDRGHGDYAASHDMEDVIAVIDNRPTIEDELRTAPSDVRRFVAEELARHLTQPAFVEALPGYLPGDTASQARVSPLRARLGRIKAM
jgi:predicted nucleotidyltransferase